MKDIIKMDLKQVVGVKQIHVVQNWAYQKARTSRETAY